MKDIVFLCGYSRTGKSSIAQMLYKKYGYNIIKIDAIINAVNQLLDNKIDKHNYDDRVKTIIVSLIKNFWSDIKNRGYKYVFDTCSINVQTANELKDLLMQFNFDIIFLINTAQADNIMAKIRKTEKPYDWTKQIDDNKLYEFCKNCQRESKEIKLECEKLKIKYIDVCDSDLLDLFEKVEKSIK